MYEREESCMCGFGSETERKEITWKTKAQIGR